MDPRYLIVLDSINITVQDSITKHLDNQNVNFETLRFNYYEMKRYIDSVHSRLVYLRHEIATNQPEYTDYINNYTNIFNVWQFREIFKVRALYMNFIFHEIESLIQTHNMVSSTYVACGYNLWEHIHETFIKPKIFDIIIWINKLTEKPCLDHYHKGLLFSVLTNRLQRIEILKRKLDTEANKKVDKIRRKAKKEDAIKMFEKIKYFSTYQLE